MTLIPHFHRSMKGFYRCTVSVARRAPKAQGKAESHNLNKKNKYGRIIYREKKVRLTRKDAVLKVLGWRREMLPFLVVAALAPHVMSPVNGKLVAKSRHASAVCISLFLSLSLSSHVAASSSRGSRRWSLALVLKCCCHRSVSFARKPTRTPMNTQMQFSNNILPYQI